ncbi:MAG: hypothetical protein AAF823_13565 [Planctomycetota bacterium]
MTRDALRELLERTPFVPFDITMSSGATHRVLSPEFVILTKSTLLVHDPAKQELVDILPLLHIAGVAHGASAA